MEDVDVKIDGELYNKAIEIWGKFPLNGCEDNSAGAVSCALRTKSGRIYTEIGIDAACGLEFCAE